VNGLTDFVPYRRVRGEFGAPSFSCPRRDGVDQARGDSSTPGVGHDIQTFQIGDWARCRALVDVLLPNRCFREADRGVWGRMGDELHVLGRIRWERGHLGKVLFTGAIWPERPLKGEPAGLLN